MLLLQDMKKIDMLGRCLIHNFPESLKVYGTIFHINQGNPFNLEVLVDSWPEFKTVITRPKQDEMVDEFDHYTNTYFIYTRDPLNLREALEKSDVINWSQSLQIQGLQENIGEVIASISASKSFKVETTRTVLYVKDTERPNVLEVGTENPLAHEAEPEFARVAAATQQGKSGGQLPFSVSPLHISHAELVNGTWAFGGNERSLRYIQRCIKHCPSICVIESDGQPVSWSVMEQSCEIRMGYTLPGFRRAGMSKQLMNLFVDSLQKKNFPFYLHVAEDNEKAKGVPLGTGFTTAPCPWYQWKCNPVKSDM